jgi:hypothetical protein
MMTTTRVKQTFEDKMFSIKVIENGKENFKDVFGTVYGDTGLAYQMCNCCNGYVVTHLPSGLKVLPSHFTNSHIQTFIRGLAKLADWTVAEPQFPAEQKDAYYELISRYAIFTNWDH